MSKSVQQLALDNQLFVQQVDSALMNAHLPPNILREMISNVNKTFLCDAECQEKKKIEKLHGEWVAAKSNVKNSENNMLMARANYFKEARGDKYYVNNVLTPEFKQEIDNRINNYQKELTKVKHTNNSVVDAYTAAFNSLERIKQLFEKTTEENIGLKNKLDNRMKFINTEERRVWYKFESIDRQKFYNKIVMGVYYLLVSIFAGIQLFKHQQLKNYKFWIKLLGLILVPFVINYSVKLVYYILFYFRMVS